MDDFEYAALKGIYEFSSQLGFRFGINQDCILTNIGYHHSGRFERVLSDLQKDGFIFHKDIYISRYWLPTKKGRQYIEKQSISVLKSEFI